MVFGISAYHCALFRSHGWLTLPPLQRPLDLRGIDHLRMGATGIIFDEVVPVSHFAEECGKQAEIEAILGLGDEVGERDIAMRVEPAPGTCCSQ